MPFDRIQRRSLPLTTAPTSVEPLPSVSKALGRDVWIKRDDRSSTAYGGNKPRKLAFALAEALDRNARAVITMGAYGSHHCLATAIHAAPLGLEVHLVVAPQPVNEHVENNVRLDLAHGATLHVARNPVDVAWKTWRLRRALARSGRAPFVVSPGGSSAAGSLGYVQAGLELAEQVARGEMSKPEEIVVAFGSGGTVGGLALGLVLAGMPVPIRAVRVAPPPLSNRFWLRGLLKRTAELVTKRRPEAAELATNALALVHLEPGHLGVGYGVPTSAGERATALAAEDGIHLDPTYTAKAFAGLVARAPSVGAGPILFWHTLSSVSLDASLANAPPAPAWLSAGTALSRR
ncbi:MAG: pyridoxal-phosphate dependent enzyme [Polyangiales bacterium]|nr:pyridoxal-phosphate dependent enzyme [Myxococcales bacterium]